mgnify:CR=1 FL=1
MDQDKEVASDILAPDILELIADESEEKVGEKPKSDVTPEGVSPETNQEEPADGVEPIESEAEESPDVTEDELSEILDLGNKIREYQKTHPGFDPMKIHGEFTRRSQENAELKRERDAALEAAKTVQREEGLPDLSDVAPETLDVLERYVKAKGFVSKEEIQRRDRQQLESEYEKAKKIQINAFLDKHPEYKPENDPGDEKWSVVLSELNRWYKLPDNPNEIGDMLERIHGTVSPTKSFDAKKAAKILAQKKVNNLGRSASGGAAASAKKKSSNTVQAAKLFKGYSESELEELFKE